MADSASIKLQFYERLQAGQNMEIYKSFLQSDETVFMEFKATRDILVITNKKIIAITIGLTKTMEILVLPYSKITAFAVETAGTFDLGAEFKIWTSAIGKVEFKFAKEIVDVREIIAYLSMRIG
jgi:hypothetical protein